jgi:CSLREA domain-containing protein
VALWILLSGPSHADTFTVTKTLDTNDGTCDSDCSLREAIIAANQHPGADTIIVPAGTYLLRLHGTFPHGCEENAAAGDLDILDNLTVRGTGAAGTVIDANHIDGAFHVHSGVVATLSGLTIQNATRRYDPANGCELRYGGGVLNDRNGTLRLTNCTLSGNSADIGGGIYNEVHGTLRLTNCTLSGNSAAQGGGIDNNGNSTLTNCTLSGNSADAGGGIFNSGISALTNCTVSGNSADDHAGGGIYNHEGSSNLTNCTLGGNSGVGIYIEGPYYGTVTAVNTIFAAGLGGAICYGYPTALVSNGHNLDEDGSCGLSNTGDQTDVPANLARVGDYGGPTQTIALCTGPGAPDSSCIAASPAIDAGDNTFCPSTDQRWAPRPYGAACDIGAYESGAQVPMFGNCTGDCNASGAVAVNEIISLVNIALGTQHVSDCADGLPAGASDEDVNMPLIIQAVNNALGSCPSL